MVVLIVEESEINARVYAQAIKKHKVHTCLDPAAAPGLMEQLRPDVLVVNLSAMTDWASLSYRPKAAIALTYFLSDSVIKWANKIGVQEVILLPCSVEYLAGRIDQLFYAAGIYKDWV